MTDKRKRFYVSDVATLVSCGSKTICTLVSQGLINCQRNYSGWRIFPNLYPQRWNRLAHY